MSLAALKVTSHGRQGTGQQIGYKVSADLVVGKTTDAVLSQEDVLAVTAVEDERELACLWLVVLLTWSVPHHTGTGCKHQMV